MERWDLYTKDREKTGKTMARGEATPEGCYRLVVHVCIFNDRGELLIQQRQSFKKGWPNLWDVSVGGHVVAGETSREAAEREVLEELGVRLSLEGVRPSVTVTFAEGFDDWYVVKRGLELTELTLQEEEVQAARYANLEEVLAMIDAGTFISYHKGMMEYLFFQRNRCGIHTRQDREGKR